MIKEYIKEILDKNYIRLNISSYATSILIIKKLNKRLKVYMDYKILNALIILNRNIFLLIKETLIKLYAIKIYSKFNIIVAFNEIHIKKDDEYKIVFLIRYNLFEYNIILFELYNASITF